MKTQCLLCQENFNDSAMFKWEAYFPKGYKPKPKEVKGSYTYPWVFGPDIRKVIDQLHCSDEEKAAARYDLDNNYELRVLSYCEKCAPLANFMQAG